MNLNGKMTLVNNVASFLIFSGTIVFVLAAARIYLVP